MRAEAEAAAEQERVRIARDMHDVVAHSLAVVIAQADGARYAAAARPGRGDRGARHRSRTTARAALADVRLLLTQLRHSAGRRPAAHARRPRDAVRAGARGRASSCASTSTRCRAGEPPAAIQLAVYRILQEALTNALRHGDGGRSTVAACASVARRPAWSSRCATACGAERDRRDAEPRARPDRHARARAAGRRAALERGADRATAVRRAAPCCRSGRTTGVSRMIRVVLVDDQALFRAGIRMLVASAARPRGRRRGRRRAARRSTSCAATRPDVVLMDIRMPVMDGLAATARDPGGRGSAAAIVMLTTFDLDEAAARAIRQGASGFLLKDADPEFLLAAIRTVHSGSTR